MASENVEAVMSLLDRFMDALNRHDAAGMDACLHFPHVRLAEGRIRVYEEPGENPMDLFDRLREQDGWERSGWDSRQVAQQGPDKIHVDVRYTRYRGDGSTIGTYDSLYIATLADGRWGIQARSSFGP